MPNIQKVDVKSTQVTGLSIRTKNANEMDVNREKIAPFWKQFENEVVPKLKEGATVYAVYHNYESDATGEFDILLGADGLEATEEMIGMTLEAGKYLMFPVKGKFPHAIVETWAKIWAYFEDESIDERRAYETDFEKYISKDELEIYIGVHYF